MSPLGPFTFPQLLAGFWAFLVGSPIKMAMWIGNRLATWTGLAVLWHRLKDDPNRKRRFLGWMMVINTLSFGLLIGIVWLITTWLIPGWPR